MKLNIKFLTFSCIVLGLCFTSCSKDGNDGEQGVQGIIGQNGTNGADGTTGLNGTDGADGINGTDGNADVHSFTVDTSELSGSIYSFEIKEITTSTLDNDVILYYLKVDELYYPIPGLGVNSSYKASAFASEGQFDVKFFEPDGVTPYETAEGQIDEIHVIIIKSTSSASKSSSPLSELNAAGVDVKDYNAVMQYYGLN